MLVSKRKNDLSICKVAQQRGQPWVWLANGFWVTTKFKSKLFMNKHILKLTSAASIAILLAGCGGGSAGIDSLGTTISGRVADGYINGAVVFWDCNGDAIPNNGEVKTTSRAGGRYDIATAPSTQCTLSAYVPVGAVDEDTPDQANSRPYTLLATPSHPEFISPLSTLSHLAGQANTSLTEEQAASQVASMLMLSGSIHTNYMLENSADGARKHAVAKVLVNVLQSQHTSGAVADGHAAAYNSIQSLAPAISSLDSTLPNDIATLVAPFRGFLAPSAPLSFTKDTELDHYAVRPNSGLGLTSAQIDALNDIINLPAVLQATRYGVIQWSELSRADMVNIVKRMQTVGITGDSNAAVQAAKDQANSMRLTFTTYYNDKIRNENKFWGRDVSTNLKFAMDTTFSAVEAVSGTVSAYTNLPSADLRPFRSSPNIKKGMKAIRKMGDVPDLVIALIKDAELVYGEDGVAVKDALKLNDGQALTDAQTGAVVHSLVAVLDVMKDALKTDNLKLAGSLFKGATVVYDGTKACEEDPASSECYGKAIEIVETIAEYFKAPQRLQGSILAVRAGFDAYSQGKAYAAATSLQVVIAQDQWEQAWAQAMSSVDKILYVQLFSYGGFEKYFMGYDKSSPVNFAVVLAEGAYEPGYCMLNSLVCREFTSYYKMTGSTGTWQSFQYDEGNGVWGGSADGYPDEYLTSAGWVRGSTNGSNSGAIILDGLGGGTGTNSHGGSFRFATTMLDLSGKTVNSIAGLTLPSALSSKIFPAGAMLYWMNSQNTADEYSVSTEYSMSVSDCTAAGSCSSTELTSIADLLAAYPSSSKKLHFADLYFSFDTGGTSTGGTVSLWSSLSATAKSGTALYEIRTVFGQQMLIVKAPTMYPGEFAMFVVNGGVLRSGFYVSSSIYRKATPLFNKIAMNAIMSGLSKPAVSN